MLKSLAQKNPYLSTLLIIFASCFLVFILVSTFGLRKEKPDKIVEFGCPCSNLTGIIDFSSKIGLFEGQNIEIPELAYLEDERKVLSLAQEERWIEIDISEQKLRAWEGDTLFLESAVSTGLPWWPTPTGEFRIWAKLRATRMEGGAGRYYYNLPNVPYVMYIKSDTIPSWRGYGLHGTYWHNDFGNPRSHGCVNLPTNIAKELYFWISPTLPDGKFSAFASETNLGGRVVIHE